MQSASERLGEEAIMALSAIRSVLVQFEETANSLIAEIQQAEGQTQLTIIENKLEVPNG